MLGPQLLATLEDLGEDDFKKFKFYLCTEFSEKWKPIPKSSVEKASSREDTVSLMINHYGSKDVVRFTVELLKEMKNNEAATKLEDLYREVNTATPSTSSSAAAPPPGPAPVTISATNGSVVIAPTLHGCTTGTWTVNYK